MTRTSKLAGEVKGGSPTKAQCDSILRNEANREGLDSLDINALVGVARTPLEAQPRRQARPQWLGLQPGPSGRALPPMPCTNGCALPAGPAGNALLGQGCFTFQPHAVG
jgi:hypothetical protein